MYKVYIFVNSKGAPSVMKTARTISEAWNKLRKTHAYYFQREGWTLREGKQQC